VTKHATAVYKPQIGLMNGFVKVRGELTRDLANKLEERNGTALAAWIQTMGRGARQTVNPQAGRAYRTGNDSHVFVTSVGSDGDAKAVVLEGGHQQIGMRGAEPGSFYTVTAKGEYHGSLPTSRLLGMALEVEIDLPQVCSLWNSPKTECTFAWLLTPDFTKQHELRTSGRSFYQTLNGSLVFVMTHPDPSGAYKSIVLLGGHGVDTFMGEKPTEVYLVDSAGTYCFSSEKARDSSPAKLAAASGMSLALRLTDEGMNFSAKQVDDDA
jgi:hypothetical protein